MYHEAQEISNPEKEQANRENHFCLFVFEIFEQTYFLS